MAAWYDEMLAGVNDAFNTGDFNALAGWVHDDAVFDWSRSISDNAGVHEGRESMRSAFEGFIETWDSVKWTIMRVDEPAPGTLVVSNRVTARVRGSDAEIEASGAQLLELRDGKIARVTLFQSRDDALAELARADR
jgi:ketosteroid isomerase-like protein